jgi:SAM-dependent methyltransferase
MLDEYLRANLARWDEWTRVHERSELYDVEGFKAGKSSLTSIEESELGQLVGDGTRLLHLQCHFGMDTLSWARRGATVTGVDFSSEAVELACRLADEVGLAGRAAFLQSNVYELPTRLSGQFDVVFTSWGVLNWLGDLEAWAQVAAAYVRPGGVFYMAEFHPFAFLLADDATPRSLRIGYPYFQYGKPLRFDEPGSYADPTAQTVHNVTYEWNHGFAEIIDPLLRNGLRLEYLHEFPYTRGLAFPILEWGDDGWQRVKGHQQEFPLSFSLKMAKEG